MLVIFDCDGVLVDSELIALSELSDTMIAFGRPMTLAECRHAFMGLHNADIVRAIEQRIGRPLPGEGPRMRARMIDRLKRELQPVPGVAAALAALEGPRCVASSSDPARIALTLELTGLSRFFGDQIFSGTEVVRGKPAPDLFLHAAASMGVAPAECIVIEDSLVGVQAGVAAGMRVIGFGGGAHFLHPHADEAVGAATMRLHEAGASAVLTHMSDLPAVLRAAGCIVRTAPDAA